MARTPKPWFWQARQRWVVQLDGRRFVLAHGAENKAEAIRKFHELMAERLANTPVDAGDPTVAAVIDAFLDYAIHRDAPSTYYERKWYLTAFVDAHGWRRVADCKAYHLASWVDSHPTWKSDWTRSYAIRSVKRPFNWAVKMGLIAKNPFAPVPHRPGGRRRPMTLDEYQRLLKAAGRTRRFGEILQFLRFTGCRPCELRHLRWEQVDFRRALIIMHEHKTSRTSRDARPRIIPLVPEVVRLLKRIRARADHAEYVFVTDRRPFRPYARCSIQNRLRRLRRRIGLPDDCHLYSLRHLFGTSSVLVNDLKTTAQLMGHRSTRVTEIYTHVQDLHDHLRAAMSRATRSAASA